MSELPSAAKVEFALFGFLDKKCTIKYNTLGSYIYFLKGSCRLLVISSYIIFFFPHNLGCSKCLPPEVIFNAL